MKKNKSIKKSMIEKGFQIDQPNVFVPWSISEIEFKKIFKGKKLIKLKERSYYIRCKTSDDHEYMLGFKFDVEIERGLNELQFFHEDCPDMKKSFNEIQEYFEKMFGEAHRHEKSKWGYNDSMWIFGKVKILHYVMERFGLEEHAKIQYEPFDMRKR